MPSFMVTSQTDGPFMTDLRALLGSVRAYDQVNNTTRDRAERLAAQLDEGMFVSKIDFDTDESPHPVQPFASDPPPYGEALAEISAGLWRALIRYPDLSDEDISDLVGAFEMTALVLRRHQPKRTG